VDRLEQENVALRAENERLKSSADAVVAAAEPKKPAAAAPSAADWPSRIALKGDVRYRHQQTDDERVAAQRDEHLLRVRTSLEAKVTDTIVAGVGFSTGDGGNPRGANTRLDGEFARKSLFVDLAYIDWTFAQGAHAIGGKMKMPFFRPGQSLYWDNDVNPEGIALTYTRGTLFSIAYGYWVDENVQVAATPSATADTTDTKLFGGQIGNSLSFGNSSLVVGASYYDLAAGVNRRPFFNGSSNGNSLNPAGGLAYDFRVLRLRRRRERFGRVDPARRLRAAEKLGAQPHVLRHDREHGRRRRVRVRPAAARLQCEVLVSVAPASPAGDSLRSTAGGRIPLH
jgi:hypothetical protein